MGEVVVGRLLGLGINAFHIEMVHFLNRLNVTTCGGIISIDKLIARLQLLSKIVMMINYNLDPPKTCTIIVRKLFQT